MKNLLFLILFFTGNLLLYSQCTVNAGGNATICGTSYTLQGTAGTGVTGTPTWTLVSKPAGAPDPVINTPNSYTPNVTGMTSPGNYVFQISQSCTSGSAFSQVTILAPGAVTTFTAGPDITNITAATGVANLSGVIPPGYTASWTYYNLFNYETFAGSTVTNNATMTNTTTATPTLSLTKKANHDFDPAYRAVMRITSINNPNCFYEDDAIVRFIPSINLSYYALNPQCVSPSAYMPNAFYIDALVGSPLFSSTSANSAGNPSFGTTITMQVISQPAGGNIGYRFIQNGRVYFTGINATGDYVFTLTIANSTGTYTTPQITYRYNGLQPNALSFQDASYPNQIRISSDGFQSGAVYCNMVNSTTPITAYFKVNVADPPSVVTTVAASGIVPAGGSPTISAVSGAGTMNRSVTFTPPSGGWQIGTYRFAMTTSSATGGCSVIQGYTVHISDSARPNVSVPNTTVCYPGSGVVSATVPLPAFQGIVNPSYFQGSIGEFNISVVSKPAGSATPTFQVSNFRSLSSTSTVISNLSTQGEYVFKIKAQAAGANAEDFLTAEYSCSGTSREGTFSVFVTTQVGANAGSDQNVIGVTTTSLNGNVPGTSTGTWSLVSKPAGAADPTIVTPSAYNSSVTGLSTKGAYTFRWTIATGSCTNSDDVILNVVNAAPGGISNGLTYWYRADKNAANTGVGTDVTGWTDMQNGTVVAQLGTNALPKYVLGTPSYFNFNAGINFTAGTQTLGNNTVRTLTSLNYDIFTLTKEGMTSGGTNPRLFSIGMDNTTTGVANWDAFGIDPINNTLERRVYNGGSQIATILPAYSSTIPSIMYYRNTNTGTNKGLNGNTLNSAIYNAQGSQFGGHIFGNTLFSSNASDNAGFIGNIGETIVYGAGTLSDTDRRRVDSYLAIKYGITLGQVSTLHYLDTDGNVVWNGAANTSYNSNIFGVSRDDTEVFHQKVSKSVNAGTILTVATISDFLNSNADASRTGFANDKTYFLLGDNNVAVPTLVGLTVAGTPMNRIQRAWLSQRKNTLSTMYLEANLSNYGGSFLPGNTVYMVVADDAAFTTNVKTVTGAYIAGKWVFSNNFDTDNVQRYITYATVAKDTDGDGVPDYLDLDNDNDGILDTNECYGEKITNGTFTGNATGWTLGGGWTYSANAVFINNDAADNAILEQAVAPLSTQMYKLTFSLGSTDWKFTLATQTASFTIKLGGVTYAVINNAIGRTNNVTMTLSNGASSDFVAYSSTDVQTNKNLVTVYIPYSYSASQDNKLQFVVSATGDDWYLDNVSLTGGCDTDGDGLPDYLDLDSDNDGCTDAMEGGDGLPISNLVTAGGTLQGGNGISPVSTPALGSYNQSVLLNLCNVGSGTCVGTTGIPLIVNQTTGQTVGTSTNTTVKAFVCTYCYKPGVTAGTSLDTKVGITALNRAGADNPDNWPMARKGGWIALESKTKGFVPNRVRFNASGKPVATDGTTLIITAPIEGMLVYDVTNKCLKMYTSGDGGITFGWYCISTQTCSDYEAGSTSRTSN